MVNVYGKICKIVDYVYILYNTNTDVTRIRPQKGISEDVFSCEKNDTCFEKTVTLLPKDAIV